jgi:hypothetical protein
VWRGILTLCGGAKAGEVMHEILGFDGQRDLVDKLHDGVTLLIDGDGKDHHLGLVFRAKDPAAVEASVLRLVEWGRTAAPPTQSIYRGVTFHTRNTWSDRRVHVARVAGRVIVGDDKPRLKALVDTLRSAAPAPAAVPPEQPPDPPALRRTRGSRPPGCNGMGVLSSEFLLTEFLPALLLDTLALRRLAPEALDEARVTPRLQRLARLFTTHHLEDVVWYSGRTEGRLVLRAVW